MGASVNKAIIIGNLGRDVELRYSAGGDAVANISVATSFKGTNSVEVTEWHRVTLFGKQAETANTYLHKGSTVYIEGRLQTRKWTDKEGVERYVTEIVADRMQMLGGKGEAAPAKTGAKDEDFSSEVPF